MKPSKMYSAIISSPVGPLGITVNGKQVTGLEFLPANVSLKKPAEALTAAVVKELKAYFENPDHQFNLELQIAGTPFQQKVWQALQKIPRGKPVSYQQLADKLQTGARAVGNACRANRIALIIPCHRVVAKNHLGGFAGHREGEWPNKKKWLLQHEST